MTGNRVGVGSISFGPSRGKSTPDARRGTRPIQIHLPSTAVIMVFKTSDPDGRADLKRAQQGPALHTAIWEFDQWLRGQIKHGDTNPTAQQIRDALWECLDDAGIKDFYDEP